MKFTILSHAGLCVEHDGVRVVCDPWLIGSCYWRSWWNFPEPPAALIENLCPDYVYLTHLHWDHFHGATLKKLFGPEQRFLVPKVPTRRMLQDLEWLGFRNVQEIPHGGELRLGPDFSLHSYQFGVAVDSAVLFRGGEHTLFNCNDCKYFGLPLRQITRRFPRIDFVLRSYSSASPIPYCVEGWRGRFAAHRTKQDYMDEFSSFALYIGARYAVPFASNHCFLHKDTFHFNDTAVNPAELQSRYQSLARRLDRNSECVVMAPGSSWTDAAGFRIAEFDYLDRERTLGEMLSRHAGTLARQYEIEAEALADFESFRKYFEGFLRAIPWPLRRLLKCRVVFRVRDRQGQHDWLVDVGAARVGVAEGAVDDVVVLETPALVLNDCTRIGMFSSWTPSKRLNIQVPSGQNLGTVNTLFSLLDLYELQTLPLARNFSLRSLGNRLRRWREAVEAGRLLLRHKLLRRPFVIAALYPLASPAGSAQK